MNNLQRRIDIIDRAIGHLWDEREHLTIDKAGIEELLDTMNTEIETLQKRRHDLFHQTPEGKALEVEAAESA